VLRQKKLALLFNQVDRELKPARNYVLTGVVLGATCAIQSLSSMATSPAIRIGALTFTFLPVTVGVMYWRTKDFTMQATWPRALDQAVKDLKEEDKLAKGLESAIAELQKRDSVPA